MRERVALYGDFTWSGEGLLICSLAEQLLSLGHTPALCCITRQRHLHPFWDNEARARRSSPKAYFKWFLNRPVVWCAFRPRVFSNVNIVTSAHVFVVTPRTHNEVRADWKQLPGPRLFSSIRSWQAAGGAAHMPLLPAVTCNPDACDPQQRVTVVVSGSTLRRHESAIWTALLVLLEQCDIEVDLVFLRRLSLRTKRKLAELEAKHPDKLTVSLYPSLPERLHLYRNSLLAVFLTPYDDTGLLPLEAISQGCLPVGFDCGMFEEVANRFRLPYSVPCSPKYAGGVLKRCEFNDLRMANYLRDLVMLQLYETDKSTLKKWRSRISKSWQRDSAYANKQLTQALELFNKESSA